MATVVCSTIDTHWPAEEPDDWPELEEIDADWPLELDTDYWDALLPDDDYEPCPEPGDFWTEAD
jgi:hypothetical protein